MLILREVLAWKASEVAELLGTTVRLGQQRVAAGPRDPLGERQRRGRRLRPARRGAAEALERYVAAFEGYDLTALTALLHEDAIMTMPPFDLWLRGTGDITGFMTTLGASCAGSRLLPVAVNGLQEFAPLQSRSRGGRLECLGDPALEISDGRITGFHCFLDTRRWFPLFGLPLHLEAESGSDREAGGEAGPGRADGRGPQPAGGGELHPGQGVDGGQAGWTEARDIADHHPGAGRRRPRAHVVTEPWHLVTGDGAGQHEYGGCGRRPVSRPAGGTELIAPSRPVRGARPQRITLTCTSTPEGWVYAP